LGFGSGLSISLVYVWSEKCIDVPVTNQQMYDGRGSAVWRWSFGGEVNQPVVGGLTTSVILARGSELPQVPLQEVIFGGRWGKEDRLDNCKSDCSGDGCRIECWTGLDALAAGTQPMTTWARWWECRDT